MTARGWFALLLATIAGALGGCAFSGVAVDGSGADTAGAPPARPSATPEGSWSLVSGTTPSGPIVIPDGRAITLEIELPHAVGKSTCNSYGGRVRVTPGHISFRKLGTTLMGCENPSAAPERRYYGALPRVRTWRLDDSTLTLTGPGVELVFRAG